MVASAKLASENSFDCCKVMYTFWVFFGGLPGINATESERLLNYLFISLHSTIPEESSHH